MSIACRTNYANVPDGGLDPLWFWRGHEAGARHAVSADRIGVVPDPLGGAFRVQRHILKDGDVMWGGERCETLSEQIGSLAGSRRYQFGFGLHLPADFDSSNSGWNKLYDFHYPNDGPEQSPIMLSIRNDVELWGRILGGPLTADQTMGSIETNFKIAQLTKGERYHTIYTDVLEDASNGILDVWVDGVKRCEQRLSTISPGRPNTTYIKLGFYRAPSDQGEERMYFTDMVSWRNGSPDEGLAYFGALPPVPPVEVDVAKAIAETKLALDELRASESYKQYKKNGSLPRTHLGKSEIHSVAALKALTG